MFSSLYLKILVNIVLEHSKTIIYIELLNKKNVVSSAEETFNESYFSAEMYEYIVSYTKESPFFYISVLDNSISQGAVPACSAKNILYYKDVSSCEYKSYKDKWTYYTEKSNIYDIKKAYNKIGVDFIFSPFIVLNNFFKDKVDSHFAMFILVEEDTLCLSVFDTSELLYAQYLSMDREVEDDLVLEYNSLDLEGDEEESIDLDDIDAIDDIDELDDFGDIADLDSIEDIDEFSESKDIEEEFAETQDDSENTPSESEAGFNEDYQRFLLIQSSINSFYKNEKYKSEFIENVYIADSIGVSGDLKKYLEEEMFLNVYIRQIHLPAEVCEIAKMELS